MIKFLLYSTIVLALFSGYYTGANRGYEVGVQDGINTFILVGLQRGTVECHYVKKQECTKRECHPNIPPKKQSPLDDLLRRRQADKRKSNAVDTFGGHIKL